MSVIELIELLINYNAKVQIHFSSATPVRLDNGDSICSETKFLSFYEDYLFLLKGQNV